VAAVDADAADATASLLLHPSGGGWLLQLPPTTKAAADALRYCSFGCHLHEE
jgi:hypothetical protein